MPAPKRTYEIEDTQSGAGIASLSIPLFGGQGAPPGRVATRSQRTPRWPPRQHVVHLVGRLPGVLEEAHRALPAQHIRPDRERTETVSAEQ